MLITKLNLYRGEWLDLVFNNRNKSYGAYELRQHYGLHMLKAMGITFSSVAIGIILYSVLSKPVVVYNDPITQKVVEIDMVHPHIIEPQKLEQVIEKPKPETTKPEAAAATAAVTRSTAIPTRVTNDPLNTVDPPVIDQIKGSIGPTNTDGPELGENLLAGLPGGKGDGKGEGDGDGTGDVVSNGFGLSNMPEPVGGNEAWAKFLRKNLRYPTQAQQEGISGRVFLSFIIEKDGHLSNIKIERGQGFGMDEEALRVLKLAPAWKPGIQNGRAVRVRYVIPINFQLPN